MKLIRIIENFKEDYKSNDIISVHDDYGQELWYGPMIYVPFQWLDKDIKMLKLRKHEIEVYI